MKQSFKPSGVCCGRIDYRIDESGEVHDVYFHGGCAGNAQGVSALVEGMQAKEAIKRLSGLNCRNGTSCPDQLARALAESLKNKA